MHSESQTIRHLADACPPGQEFRFVNGQAARSLEEFHGILRDIPTQIVDYHRGHFGYWLHDIIADPELAERVSALANSRADGERFRGMVRDLVSERLHRARRSHVKAGPVAVRVNREDKGGASGKGKSASAAKGGAKSTGRAPKRSK